MVKYLKDTVRRLKNSVDNRKATPWDKYPVGSKAWIEAHRGKNGKYNINNEDLKALLNNPEWRKGYTRFKMALIHLLSTWEKKGQIKPCTTRSMKK